MALPGHLQRAKAVGGGGTLELCANASASQAALCSRVTAIASLAAAITVDLYGGGSVGDEFSVILLLNIKHLFLTSPVASQQQYVPLICKCSLCLLNFVSAFESR